MLQRDAMRLGAGVFVCALVMHAHVAGAAPGTAPGGSPQGPQTASRPTSEERRALELFEESVKAYRDGHFDEAVEKLLEARKAKREPVLLFNLGRAYEALGRNAEAADAYASYLAEEPGAVDRRALEARISVLRGQANDRSAASTRAPRVVPAPDEAVDRERMPPASGSAAGRTAPWVVTGAGVAAVGAGLVLGAVAKSKRDDAAAEPVQQTAATKHDEATSMARGATITIVAGSVVTAVGIVWLVVRALESNANASRASSPPLRSSGHALSRVAPGFTF